MASFRDGALLPNDLLLNWIEFPPSLVRQDRGKLSYVNGAAGKPRDVDAQSKPALKGAAMASYASIMVALDLGPDVAARTRLASDLANRFGARVIGVAARQPAAAVVGEGGYGASLIIEQDQLFALEELQDVEAAFRSAVGARNRISLRTAVERPDAFLLKHARAADLIVVGRQGRGDHSDWRFAVDPGDIALQAGRPVLIAPPQVESLSARRVVIAWKDAPEARRAVQDAMPILREADDVLVVAVGDNASRAGAADVQEYLELHGVKAKALLHPYREASVGDELIRLARSEGADLIVGGAYGHSRTREWIFGGVTQDLLDHAPICCLLAH